MLNVNFSESKRKQHVKRETFGVMKTYWRGSVVRSIVRLVNDVFSGTVNIQQEQRVVSSTKPAEEQIEINR